MNKDSDTRGDLPLTQAEEQAQEQTSKREDVEVIIDNDYVSIPRSRYDELLKNEAWLEAIIRIYRTNGNAYRLDNLLEALFGPGEAGDNA